MKKITLIFFTILLLTNCTKEVGKEIYNLTFTFSSDEQIITECLIYEKDKKKYKSSKAENLIDQQTEAHLIYIETQLNSTVIMGLILFKTEAHYLAGINDFHASCANASFAGGQNVDLQGVIDMNGAYGKKWRKFTVDEGTFTFKWNNAAEYGETNKTLTGTWTLKRK